jgi:hypothetical protein
VPPAPSSSVPPVSQGIYDGFHTYKVPSIPSKKFPAKILDILKLESTTKEKFCTKI